MNFITWPHTFSPARANPTRSHGDLIPVIANPSLLPASFLSLSLSLPLTCPALSGPVLARPASSRLASPLLDRLHSPTPSTPGITGRSPPPTTVAESPSQVERVNPSSRTRSQVYLVALSLVSVQPAQQRSVPHSTNHVEASSPKTFISAVIRATARDKEKPPSCRHSACVVLPPNHHNKPLPLPRSSPHLKEWWSQQSSPYSTAVPFNTSLLHPVLRCPTVPMPHVRPKAAHVPGAGWAAAQCSALCAALLLRLLACTCHMHPPPCWAVMVRLDLGVQQHPPTTPRDYTHRAKCCLVAAVADQFLLQMRCRR